MIWFSYLGHCIILTNSSALKHIEMQAEIRKGSDQGDLDLVGGPKFVSLGLLGKYKTVRGPLTQMQCWRRHISASSSRDGWGSLERAPASSDHSTPALWRASWPAVSPPGLETARLETCKALQSVERTAHHIVGGELPSLQDIYTRRCIRKAQRNINDSSHPSHRLLSLLPSGRRLRSIRSRTSRLIDSFFPQAIRLMNNQN